MWSLVLLGLLYPVLDVGLLGRVSWTIMLWGVLFAAVRVCFRRSFELLVARVLLGVLLVLATVLVLFEGLTESEMFWLRLPAVTLHVAFFGWAIRVILVDVLLSRRVTGDTIFGAASVYMMLGVAGAYVFDLVLLLDKDAFLMHGQPIADGPETIQTFLYFSFVTLTTLGYGDITPQTSVGRLVSTVLAVFGQLYLTILVARLVGLHVSDGVRGPRA